MGGRDTLYIGGQWVAARGSDVIEVVSPLTEQVVATVPAGAPADIDAAVQAARSAFDQGEWPRMAPDERLEVLRRLSKLYAERLPEMAALITEEMGASIRFSTTRQAPSALKVLDAFLRIGEQQVWEEERAGFTVPSMLVRREPVGVVAAIVPWNVPQISSMSKIAPALVAGCTAVLKPAPETPLDAFLLAEIAHEAGLPPGVLNVVPAGREVGEYLVGHPGVDKVAFTGSTAAGRRIAAVCGEHLKRCSLELGGKSAAIVLDDADLASTMEGLKDASLMNNGQVCVAQTRILASERRYDEVLGALAEMVGGLQIGDPSDPDTDVGPLVADRQRARVEEYIALGQAEGAAAVVGGTGRPEGVDTGWFVKPTVFADVRNDMRIAQEEIFGPVLVVIPYRDTDDAVRIANDSPYGLSGSVWTSDEVAGVEIARHVRTGSIGINKVRMDYFAPFGGVKASGIGREFGREGLEAYLEPKTIYP